MKLARRPYPYRTSHALDELELELAGGGVRTLLLKGVDPVAKPDFLQDPLRELAAYRLLERHDLGTPVCYGLTQGGLLLEKVDGVELWQVGDLERWRDVLRWLARLHEAFAGGPEDGALLRHDLGFYERFAERARAFGADVPPRHREVAEHLARLPRTLLHGDLYPSNVLVSDGRVCAVDWELAAVGPAVMDVAAITSGWSERDTASLVEAYLDARGATDRPSFLHDLDCARLQLAVQWLGWSQGWRPPAEHAHDWRAELRAAAERLGL